MNKSILVALVSLPVAIACAQDATPPPASPAAASDVESLRQQVQALTETVKALQQQVKDQQAALEKANIVGAPALPQSGGRPQWRPHRTKDGTEPPTVPRAFPTEDTLGRCVECPTGSGKGTGREREWNCASRSISDH